MLGKDGRGAEEGAPPPVALLGGARLPRLRWRRLRLLPLFPPDPPEPVAGVGVAGGVEPPDAEPPEGGGIRALWATMA